MRADRRRPPVRSIITIALVACAVGCGGTSARPFRVGVVTDCYGAFAQYRPQALAGAELPLLERGAKLHGQSVSTATVGGRTVELVPACERWGHASSSISALRQLVEVDHVDAVIGSEFQDDSVITAAYARLHPHTTFMLTGSEPSVTLTPHPSPNVFRFVPDTRQSTAGLAAYAYHTLGWRSVATVADNNSAGWGTVSGFIAEFCSLGGTVARRVQSDALDGPPTRAAYGVPDGVDGAFIPGGFEDTTPFIAAWRMRHPDLARHLVLGWAAFDPALRGVVGASYDPFRPTPAWNRYVHALHHYMPVGFSDQDFFNEPYYDGMSPLLLALQKVGGDTSHGQRRLMSTLAHLTYPAEDGPIHLDKRHQAVANAYLGQMSGTDHPIRQIAVVPGVEQTFGGYFGPNSPSPSRSQPGCRSGNPPSWARS